MPADAALAQARVNSALVTGWGLHAVQRTATAGGFRRKEKQPDEILDMNPGHPLLPAAEAAAET